MPGDLEVALPQSCSVPHRASALSRPARMQKTGQLQSSTPNLYLCTPAVPLFCRTRSSKTIWQKTKMAFQLKWRRHRARVGVLMTPLLYL